MNLRTDFYLTTIKYCLTNKFVHKKVNTLPKLSKIVLSFNSRTTDHKKILSNLLMFELIATQKGYVRKKAAIGVTTYKGNPIGCKLTLKKQNLFNFLISMTLLLTGSEFFNLNQGTLSLKIKDTFSFFKLETHYYFFNSLSNLNLTVVTTTQNKKEILFFYKLLSLNVSLSKIF
jgi:large subunit ribosomal protein L5